MHGVMKVSELMGCNGCGMDTYRYMDHDYPKHKDSCTVGKIKASGMVKDLSEAEVWMKGRLAT